MSKNKSVISIHKGKTFASASKAIERKYKDRDVNPMSMRSFEQEIETLVAHQEKLRLQEIAVKSLKDYRKPTDANKYETGGPMLDALQAGLNYASPGVPASSMFPNPFDSAVPVVNPLDASTYGQALQSGRIGQAGDYQATKSDLPYRPDVPAPLAQRGVVPQSVSALSQSPQVPQDLKNPYPSKVEERSSNIYNPLIVGKGLEFLGKAGLAATGYDKVPTVYNPNESRTEALMASRGIDNQALENQALSQQNVALQNLNDVRSPNVKRALVQNAIQSTLKSIQQNQLQQDSMNNQYKGDYASTLNNLGQQRVGAENYAEQLNTQERGANEQRLTTMLADVGYIGNSLTNYRAGKAQQELITSFMSTKDFKAGSAKSMIEKVERGETPTESDIIQLAKENNTTVDEAKNFLNSWNTYKSSLYGK